MLEQACQTLGASCGLPWAPGVHREGDGTELLLDRRRDLAFGADERFESLDGVVEAIDQGTGWTDPFPVFGERDDLSHGPHATPRL